MSDVRVVKWAKGWTEGEFMAAVVRAGGLERGSVVELEYAHDEDCPKPTGGICRCDPDVVATIRPAPRAA
jgi:hypothetical protein